MCRLILAQPLIGSTIRELSISFSLSVLEVMLYTYIDSVFIISITVRYGGRFLEDPPARAPILVSLLKPAAQAQVDKTKLFINCLCATPQAHAQRKTEKQTQGSNQRLTSPLNPSNVPVSTTV